MGRRGEGAGGFEKGGEEGILRGNKKEGRRG
jgi:hypothetical protein